MYIATCSIEIEPSFGVEMVGVGSIHNLCPFFARCGQCTESILAFGS